jgi:methylenetetrahydrofolate dehydrogenase (NADP+)/methenyltetrahydrofolate cyclohydrolase
MDTRVIDGIALSGRLRTGLAARAAALAGRGVRPGLAAVEVGEHPASRVYVRNKLKACAEVGLHSEHVALPGTITEADLLARIRALNDDPRIHGILVQLPLPAQITPARVLDAVAPTKDVDAFHPVNVGLLVAGQPRFVPCTPAAVMAILDAEGVNPWAQQAVIVGASNIVGKPVAMLLLQRGATVTICNSKTRDLADHTARADILVVAVGKARLVTGAMVKPGAVVIDVGINRLPDGKLVGDCDFPSLLGVAGAATPVPGGVGPMTITMLLANTIRAAELAFPDEDVAAPRHARASRGRQ